MKPLAKSPWKQRIVFFFAGAIFAFVCGFVHLTWMDIVPYETHDSQPASVKTLRELIGWLPWLVFAVVLVLRSVKGPRIRVGFYFLGTLTPMVIFIAWMVLGPSLADLAHRRQFNAELWRSQGNSQPDPMWPPRLCMVDHLVSGGRLDGLTRSEVVELLGPPHYGSHLGGVTYDMNYYLGPERGFIRIDSEWLCIAFGENGKVSRSWIERD